MSDLEDFIDFLYGDSKGYVYAPVKKGPNPTDWVQKFYQYPQEKQGLIDWIKACGQESDVFLAPAIFREKSAKKEAVVGSNVVWIELDGQKELDLKTVPAASAVIQSSVEGHYHVYWKVPFSPKDVIESVNRRLTYFLGADSSGWDANQILRPPGSTNFKRSKPVSLTSLESSNYDISVFDGIPEPAKPEVKTGVAIIPAFEDVLALGKFSDKLWELIKNPESGVGLRSSYLMHLGYMLAEEGFTYEQIFSVVKYADGKVGKFLGRSDRNERIAQIASLALGKYVAATISQPYSFLEILNDDTPIEYLWEPHVVRGLRLIISGAPGVGKSQFTLDLALSMSSGRKDFLGQAISRACKVAYFSMEMDKKTVQYVFKHQVKGYTQEEVNKIQENLYIVPTGYAIPWKEVAIHVENSQPDVVFIDSMFAVSTGDVKDDQEIKKFFSEVDKIRTTYNCAVVIIHHNRKASDNNRRPKSLDDLYGSVFIAGSVDSSIILWSGDGDNIEVISPKTRYGKVLPFKTKRDENLCFVRQDKVTKSLQGFTVGDSNKSGNNDTGTTEGGQTKPFFSFGDSG